MKGLEKGTEEKLKDEKERDVYDDESAVMPLGRERDSKMSGEEPPLEVLCTQDKTQNTKILNSLSIPTKFPFYFKIQCVTHEARHPLYRRE